jgi:opacity protein-like surface antigen
MRSVATAIATLAISVGTAGAADLMVDDAPIVPDETITSGVYAQFLVGAALPGIQYWVDGGPGEWDLELGPAAAAAIGVTLFEGLSVELDALYTNRAFDPADAEGDSTTFSLMGNLKYTFAISDNFDIYVAGGAGYIREIHLDEFNFGGWGYQLIAGAAVDVTENFALVGEYRFQDSFSPLVNTEDPLWTHEVPKHVLLVGAKVSFP